MLVVGTHHTRYKCCFLRRLASTVVSYWSRSWHNSVHLQQPARGPSVPRSNGLQSLSCRERLRSHSRYLIVSDPERQYHPVRNALGARCCRWDNQRKLLNHLCHYTDHHQDTYPEWSDLDPESEPEPSFAVDVEFETATDAESIELDSQEKRQE